MDLRELVCGAAAPLDPVASAMVIWRQYQVLSFELGPKPPHAEVNGKSQLQDESNQHPLKENVPVGRLFHFHLVIGCFLNHVIHRSNSSKIKKMKKMEDQA